MIALLPLLALVPAPQEPAPPSDILTLWVAEGETLFRHPKDQALLQALRLIDDRVLELPGEIPDFPPLPPDAITLATRLLVGEKTIRVGEPAEPAGPLPIFFQLALAEGSAEAAAERHASLRELIGGFGLELPEPDESGATALPVPAPFPIWMGAMGEHFAISVGQRVPAAATFGPSGLPDGVRPDLLMHLDYARFIELMMGMAAMDDPAAAEMMSEMFSALGVDDLIFDVASGSDDERSYSVTRMTGYGRSMRESGLMPTRLLASGDVALVPRDATWASVGVVNARATLDVLLGAFTRVLEMSGEETGDPVEMIQGMTGFHVYEDFVDHLGPVWGLYASDTTGGGGLLSTVALMELSDAEGMRATLERLAGMVDGLGEMEAEGYVRTRAWEHAGAQLVSVTFPGLPVPCEPTLATTGKYLFLAATPQAAVAALGQAAGGSGSLLDDPRFRAQLPGPLEGAVSVGFFDTPRLLADGYGLTSLACSALVNGTRSRSDPSRDAGLILPSYRELAEGTKVAVSLGRIQGDDLVSEMRSDPSVLVNLAALGGFVASSPLVLVVPGMIAGLAGAKEAAAPFVYEIK